MTRLVVPLLPFRFDPDYVCAGCGGRFRPGDGHDYAACAARTESTEDSIYAAAAVWAQ